MSAIVVAGDGARLLPVNDNAEVVSSRAQAVEQINTPKHIARDVRATA